MGLVNFTEPFKSLMNQGQVLNGGKAMSKSLGNGVDLAEQLDAFGVDAVRLTMIFASPPEDDVDWADVSPSGSAKFLARAWRIAQEVTSETGADPAQGAAYLRAVTHRTIADAEQLLEAQRYNVVVARLMELVNAVRKEIDSGVGPQTPPCGRLLRRPLRSCRWSLPIPRRTCGRCWAGRRPWRTRRG